MKNASLKNAMRAWMKGSASLLGLITLTLLTACGGGGGGGNTAATVPYGYAGGYGAGYGTGYYGATGCASCSSYGMIASAMGRNNSGDELYLDLYGDPARMQQMQAYGATQYYGPAAGVGMFLTPTGVSYCGVPPGQYNITSSQQGVWGVDGAGRAGQLVLMAQGPVQFQIVVQGQLQTSSVIQGRNGRPYNYTMSARMFINGDPRCEIDTF